MSLSSATISNGVTSIGNGAFANCIRLTSIVIPDSVTSIGERAFQSCSLRESVTIGSGITSIGDGAFNDNRSLGSVTIKAVNPPTLGGSNVFKNTLIASGTGHIYVPSSSVNAYKTASGWSTYANQIEAIH
jgi:hypothetical protein